MKDKLVVIEDDVKFELILNETKISYHEESPRYRDTFSTKFTFPFEFHLDRDLRIIMGDFSSMNAANLKTVYDNCFHVVDGKIKKAKLKIMESTGEVIKAQIDSGFEEFPNWNTKLRDLPLEILETNQNDLSSVAQQTITKSYPEVNYNFPMVHTDLYKDDDPFIDFEGTLNKRVNGQFVVNTGNVQNNEYKNKNIVIPFPYWLHVLKTGFESVGFTLHGDVLENDFIKQLLVVPGKYKLFDRPENVEVIMGIESFNFLFPVGVPTFSGGLNIIKYGFYKYEQSIEHYGKFRFKGTGRNTLKHLKRVRDDWYPRIYFNDEIIYEFKGKGWFNFDVIFKSIPGRENKLKISLLDHEDSKDIHLEGEIIPLELYDEDGNKLPELANIQQYNLSEGLPDQTFGHFVTTTKNLLNLDMDIRNGTEVWMNHIYKSFDKNDMIDISEFEVANPRRIFDEELSFILKFKEVEDVENESYVLKPIFYDRNGVKTENYIDDENTKEIKIDAYPLPVKMRGGNRTAYQFKEMQDAYQLVTYEGLKFGKNITSEPSEWSLSVLFHKYWIKWLYFRVHASSLQWRFIVNKNRWKKVSIIDALYAYKNKLWIRKMTKTSINEKTYEIDIEADVVKN